jgi:hypothetical protein
MKDVISNKSYTTLQKKLETVASYRVYNEYKIKSIE